ncbi:hypothetical protein U732_1130 [Clostridium argentinense CDC 2741]|uniref:Uncharacterized protein n=1 Tax=Clostridium argentinense CDC 2741 TaxID=1418104 RepID=A0A0C1U676_9CLOT|nr:hypothetical protein [Clostridium argentinense]ARC85636.1 hypothetical protein RSJ17_14540 [Clostridium argentinense]KIE47273.1 hypothetical protein U732_1130 [Clostridium argentinense CDC 2741]NFF40843.1 hypothetical protein [Clostridium argentinense]NFP50775.1 hypothetical protein [Clostridium argentinense]NFP73068.1 hypothetical protein [Clostridium argentinense]
MSLPSYVINFDELSNLIKDYLQNGINVDVGNVIVNTEDIERLLKDIGNKIQGVGYDDLIEALNALGVKIDGLSGNLGISGTQKIYGEMLQIPAIKGHHIIEFIVPKKGRITGITYSQSSWGFEDSWNLVVREEELFNNITTKEYGEHKHFNVFYPVTSGDKIKFIFNNESSSSKVLWVDFNILED